jgi:hypothetical protein
MSIVILANKTKVRYKTKHAKANPPGKHWLPHGPFGSETSINSIMLADAIAGKGESGFSINGSHRNKGWVGKTYQMSKSGTPFKGLYPRGHGGKYGKYATRPQTYYTDAIVSGVETKGNQHQYMNPVNASMRTVMNTNTRNKLFVKPLGQANQSDMYSQGMFLHKKRVANGCVLNNSPDVHEGDTDRKTCTYTKDLNSAMTGEQYITVVQKGCDIGVDPSLKKTSFCVQANVVTGNF